MTALTATPQAGTAFYPPRVLLQVTGAPTPPAGGYTSNFNSGSDGWAPSGTGVGATLNAGNTYLTLAGAASGTIGNVITASRTVTGLTVGALYKFRATVSRTDANSGNTRIRFGTATSAYVALPNTAPPPPGGTVLELNFTATATSHVIAVDQQRTSTSNAERVYIMAASVAPVGTWQGTTIRRTDINGAGVIVREDQGGMDVIAGGTMTLYDLEAALTGPIGYAVTDGNGVITYATTSYSAGARVNLVTNPSFEVDTSSWVAAGTGATIARSTTVAHSGGASLKVTSAGTSAGATYVLTGLTIGATYTVSAWVYIPTTGGTADFRVNPQGAAAGNSVTAAGVWTRTWCSFVPTATSWSIFFDSATTSFLSGSVYIDDVMVEQVATLGTYFDGSTPATTTESYGWVGTPSASPSMAAARGETTAGAWLTLPATATPSLGAVTSLPLESVLDYAESSDSNGSLHKVIGRRDPIANPGPLSLRTGTLELYCRDYLTAKLTRDALSTGEVALVRQPTYLGLDVYFVSQRISIRPADDETGDNRRRWVASVEYAEVLAA